MKENAVLLPTQEVIYALRRNLGDVAAWHSVLECMRNDSYRLKGLRLLPVSRMNDERGRRLPHYDAEHVRQFIRDFRAVCGEAVANLPLVGRRGSYDPDKHWKLQDATIT